MALYRLAMAPGVAETIRRLPPQIKRSVRSAIRSLAANPAAGEPLHGELEGRRKYRVRRYRIVYQADPRRRIVRVLTVGHRRSVYEELAAAGEAER